MARARYLDSLICDTLGRADTTTQSRLEAKSTLRQLLASSCQAEKVANLLSLGEDENFLHFFDILVPFEAGRFPLCPRELR